MDDLVSELDSIAHRLRVKAQHVRIGKDLGLEKELKRLATRLDKVVEELGEAAGEGS